MLGIGELEDEPEHILPKSALAYIFDGDYPGIISARRHCLRSSYS